MEVGRVKDQRHQEQSSPNYTSISDLRLIRARPTMADIPSRKVFKVFNQDFIVDERYTVSTQPSHDRFQCCMHMTCHIVSTPDRGMSVHQVRL